ncbi:hypothetical protein K7432_017336, partial [Basidiobolus ranarum]
AHVLEYTFLLQSRADEEQRKDLQEVIASKKKEITILKESLQDLAKANFNMVNSPNFTIPSSRTTLTLTANNPTSTPRASTSIGLEKCHGCF